MKIIADAGGSTIYWHFLEPTGATHCCTTGFNPYTHAESDLTTVVLSAFEGKDYEEVTQVFYYGAGLTAPFYCDKVSVALQKCFPLATIATHSDLLGAAHALCGHTSGIICILGTGANCGFYNGRTLHMPTPSLGWALGDEGSGAYLGKQLIQDYMYKKMPDEISTALVKQHSDDTDAWLRAVYKEARPATMLASFSPFLKQHINHSYCHQLVYNAFLVFYNNHIKACLNYHTATVHFAGSIAYHYADILKEIAKEMGVVLGNIVDKPGDRLVHYHQQL